MNNAIRFALAAACAFAFSSSAQASEAAYLKRFHGQFAGSGQARLEATGAPRAISCKVSGSSTANSIDIGGSCNAGLFSKNISASLHAASNGRYTGTFNGISGPASLSGRRNGNTIVLALRGAKPATMRISNSGSGISLSVVANSTQLTQVSLSRSGTRVASLSQ